MTTSAADTRDLGLHRWDNNECCQCHSRNSVWSKHIKEEHRYANSPVPITWVCVVCQRHVCINCIYTIPNSVPEEIANPTCCSAECRQKWREQGGVEEDDA